jgi:lipopolysaccharide/colanic/teichoic acid biosynthesis glycosyltransferase
VIDKFYVSYGKRILDLALAVLALVCSAPLLIWLVIWVRVKLGSPVIFRQVRPGLWGRPFTLLKFRTMTGACNSHGDLLPDGDRLTGFGRRLRRTSLDELPEIINVLRGDMSFVGPRPLLMEYLPRYSPEQARRHETKPGITGWAQVSGRNAINWEEKFKLDVWYVDNISMALDFRILFRTVGQVFKREGIAQSGHATMPKFLGTNDSDS